MIETINYYNYNLFVINIGGLIMKKRTISIILSVLLVLSVLPVYVSAESGTENVSEPQVFEYIGSDGSTVELSEYNTVTSTDEVWQSGDYVVSEKVNIPHTVRVQGTVNLILCDGAELTVDGTQYYAGIYLTPGNTLNIFGQSRGNGVLRVTAGDFSAAIGGSGNDIDMSLDVIYDSGDINIYSGCIYAAGDYGAAAIGGAFGGNCGNITVNGGVIQPSLKEDCDFDSVCFGEGYKDAEAATGTLTINGGVIRARSAGGVARCKTVTVAEDVNVYDLKNHCYDYGLRVNMPSNPITDALIGGLAYLKDGQSVNFDFTKFAIYEGQTTLDNGSFYYVIDTYTLPETLHASHNKIVVADHVTLDARNGRNFDAYSGVYAQTEGNSKGEFLLDKVYAPDGQQVKVGNYRVYNGETSLQAGWYYVAENLNISENVSVYGKVRFIIADGATLSAFFAKYDNGSVTAYTESFGENKGILDERKITDDCPDGYYMAYNTEYHELTPYPIPQDAVRLAPPVEGKDITLGNEEWYYVESDVELEGFIFASHDVNIVLEDGCNLTCRGIRLSDGNLTVYAQSSDKAVAGNFNINTQIGDGRLYDNIETENGDVTIHGGNITGCVESKAITKLRVVRTRKFYMYSGTLEMWGHYDDAAELGFIYDTRHRLAPITATEGVFFDYCAMDVRTNDSPVTEIRDNQGTVKAETKVRKVHIKSSTHGEKLPYIGENGEIVDGVCKYYTCFCGCNFSNSGLTERIDDLESWKQNEGRLRGVAVAFDYGYDSKTEIKAVAAGRTVSVEKAPLREPYAFVGWYDENGKQWDFSAPVNENITLYAKWHTHEWSPEWNGNDMYHWHNCNCTDCPVTDTEKMDSYGMHSFEDGFCTVCGRVENLDAIKQTAYSAIDAAVSKCPSEVLLPTIITLGEKAKSEIANTDYTDGIYEIVDNYTESVFPSVWSVTYYDENGKAQSIDDYYLLKSADRDVTLTQDKWYVAESNAYFSNPIITEGSVHIILCDGVTVHAAKGITLTEGNELAVYSESIGSEMGEIISVGRMGCAGIGAYTDTMNETVTNAGTLIINGGNIYSKGGLGAAGIGGGFAGNGGTVTINGGIVEAEGGLGNNSSLEAAGIGGGYAGECGTVVINNVQMLTSKGGRALGAGLYCSAPQMNVTVNNALSVESGSSENSINSFECDGQGFIKITNHGDRYLCGIADVSCGFENEVTVMLTDTENPENVYIGKTDGTNVYYVDDAANGTYILTATSDGAVTRTYSVEITDCKVIKSVELYTEGDVNGDGEITITDYQQTVNTALGEDNAVETKTDLSSDAVYSKTVADFDGDGKIDVLDIVYIERKMNIA